MEKTIEKYIPSTIEKKWQTKWKDSDLYKSDLEKENKYYVLAEFAYPSGDLHMGHWFTFGGADVFARFKRMSGHQVFFPNGFDAFGLPAENAAIKRGVHPQDWTVSNIAKMKEQYASMGASFTFDHEVVTCDPIYYKWNQWIFNRMFEKGLAYRAKALSNWCNTCQTVLANEGIENGTCWRCHNVVVQKEIEQWFFKITEYADKLLWPDPPAGGPTVDWPKSVRDAQNDWIGKTTGAAIEFEIENSKEKIRVFTTRADTLYGGTFLVLAPEHPLVSKITANPQVAEVKAYQDKTEKKTELERKEMKEKTGVFTGAYVINPLSGEKMPIWIADYALMGYGTGALFGDAHDERDVEFAKKYNISLKVTVITGDEDKDKKIKNFEEVFTGYGTLIESGEFTGLTSQDAIKKVIEVLKKNKKGEEYVVYHLHDWSVSRQRYWGTPVPIIHCKDCGDVMVPDSDLPVVLPYDVDYAPKGKPPLATNEKWLNVECPKCKKPAKRDPETMDTFIDSSWYFFRYLDPKNTKEIFGKTVEKRMMPVDIYFGGAEHTLGHTLYSRFFTKFFKDLGLTTLSEYAQKRVNHGVILGPDGFRMSKSKGNVVNPDEEVKKYGADTIRVYLAFFMPYEATGPWISDRVWGAHRFLQRVWGLFDKVSSQELSKDDLHIMHKTIAKVTADIESISFNTAVAALMEWLNYLSAKETVTTEEYKTLLLLLAPFAPHMTEELWERVSRDERVSQVSRGEKARGTRDTLDTRGTSWSIHQQSWPMTDNKYLVADEVTVVVQINGKARDTVSVQSSKLKVQSFVEQSARESDKVKAHLEGKKVRKVVYVEGKIINFVAN